ncbi:MAG: cobalt-precorrin-5B (C(1))-methyltransferase [Rhodospirillales bacterium]|nr:cobalt-precorrin-5B (C(1))-methyltransferase [Rhodospirillales bacterium]
MELRRGWTTGACAAAAAVAAYQGLVTGRFPKMAQITLPGGQTPAFALHEYALDDDGATAAVEKDAGDDPDVTHGAIIRAAVKTIGGEEIVFLAGDGVGTVTKPGLPLGVGEPAINPAPRKMITENIAALAKTINGPLGLEITISIDDGVELAKHTWNPRLGIIGGLSVLGTTGIVVPYSCSAWIASIHQAVDVARAGGITHVAASTGSVSEDAVAALYGFDTSALIDMGDFVGGLLKHMRGHPIPKLTIAGGFGKLSKLANGHQDLHSKRSQVDPAFIASLALKGGADADFCSAVKSKESAGQILELATSENVPLPDWVAAKARQVATEQLRGTGEVEIIIYDREGEMVGRAGFIEE